MKLSILLVGFFFALCKGQETRIAGGVATTINAFPYAVSLLTNAGTGITFRHGCGGTILTNNAILSAASCFFTGTNVQAASWWRARIGSSYSGSGGVIHLINRITPHVNYQPTTLNNNLAVLRTTFAMELVPGQVEQVFIPGAAYSYYTNQRLQAIGWGATALGSAWSEQLRQAEIFVSDQTVCTNRYAAINVQVTSNMVCAGWVDVGVRGQCAGDVGSPLMDGNTVVGVFSHAQGCADDWFMGLNVRIPNYASWIVSAATAA